MNTGAAAVISAPRRVAGLAVLFAGSTRRMFATRPPGEVAAIAVILGLCRTAPADEPPPLPPAADCVSAFNEVDSWIRTWRSPGDPQLLDPTGTTGACVTLRLSGRVLGRGTAFGSQRDTVWRAYALARVQAIESLPAEDDALRARRIEEMTPRVTLDIQIAGRLTPLLIEDDSAAAMWIEPGIEGVAVRVGDRLEGVFPGTMLSTGVGTIDALRAAMSKLNLPPRPLAELKRSANPVIYEFPVRHLAQAREQAQPEFLHRGGRVIPLGEVTGARLRSAASAISKHLVSHAWPGSEPCGMTGEYLALSDRYEPVIAAPLEQAACAFALARYSTTPGIAEQDASRARRFAAELLDRLVAVAPEESDPAEDPLACAMWVSAARVLGESGVMLGAPEDARARMLQGLHRAVALKGDAANWNSASPATGRGMIALGLAYASRDDETLSPLARAAVRSVFRETEAARLVSEMPWLGWAELALAQREVPLPGAVALLDMRAAASQFRLDEDELEPSAMDLLGGIMFTRSQIPLPTWHTLRPAAFLATMLGDPRLTPSQDVVAQLADLKPILRFTLQLMMDDPALLMCRDRERSLGGVRPAVWEQRAALEPSALALLTISESLRSIEARTTKAPAPEGK